jgi:hypothetical protein
MNATTMRRCQRCGITEDATELQTSRFHGDLICWECASSDGPIGEPQPERVETTACYAHPTRQAAVTLDWDEDGFGVCADCIVPALRRLAAAGADSTRIRLVNGEGAN